MSANADCARLTLGQFCVNDSNILGPRPSPKLEDPRNERVL
jgi:hypothetical protein